MPGKNVVKEFAPESFYHVYSRGVAKQTVFLDDQDYTKFIGLLKRYLDKATKKRSNRSLYPDYNDRVDLLAYCLMPNHIHLLLYQRDADGMALLMKSVMTSYGMYFNRKYDRVGPVFQGRYRASRISQDNYLYHISRYIHLNPRDWETYPYSSLKYYMSEASADWVKPDRVLELFPNTKKYLEFIRDYEGYKSSLAEISWDLADS